MSARAKKKAFVGVVRAELSIGGSAMGLLNQLIWWCKGQGTRETGPLPGADGQLIDNQLQATPAERRGRAEAYLVIGEFVVAHFDRLNIPELKDWLGSSAALQSRGPTLEHAGRASGFARALVQLRRLERLGT